MFRGDFHWQTQAWPRIYPALQPVIGNSVTYEQAQVSRPVYFSRYGAEALEKWRAIFEKRNIIFVYGAGSRFTKSPDLFGSCSSSIDIHSMPTNAFDDIPRLIEIITEKSNSDSLVLIALGPAGTILVHKLSQLGLQALDIGHLSASYEYWAHGSLPPEQLPVEHEVIAENQSRHD